MKKNVKNSLKNTWSEFKAFINRGNALNLAVGVVIGGAFTAIVTALTNVLMAICTWGVPGGLNGLITVLPPANDLQKGMAGIGQTFASGQLQDIAQQYAESLYGVGVEDALVQALKSEILSKYTLYGSIYVSNSAAVINWGSIINAVISFLIIAIVLFIVIKVVTSIISKKNQIQEKLKEEYYQKHPEERPIVVPEEVKPTELDVLLQIKALLEKQQLEKTETPDKK